MEGLGTVLTKSLVGNAQSPGICGKYAESFEEQEESLLLLDVSYHFNAYFSGFCLVLEC